MNIFVPGYRVLAAGDGEEALKLLGRHPGINLLFSDIVMPSGINGYELAEQAIAIQDELKILFTSGFGEKAESGSDQMPFNTNLLNKPYSKTELIQQIRSTLDATKTR